MISLTCTNCRTTLTIDDAFAGGVCRCQHCGTIQTVPSHLKRTSRAAAPGHAPGSAVTAANDLGEPVPGQKALYKRRARVESTAGSLGAMSGDDGTGLEDLAGIVGSSGLSGSGIASGRLRTGTPGGASSGSRAGRRPRSFTPLFVAAGAALAIAAVVIFWFVKSGSSPDNAQARSSVQPTPGPEVFDTTPVNTNGPNFCGITLDDSSVIYVLDRGNGTREMFDTLKEVTYKSIRSLGSDRKFQVIFWDNGSGEEAYPSGAPAFARAENLTACKRVMEDTTAFGQSDPAGALAKAFANHPGAIVLATGKGLDLDEPFVEQVMKLRAGQSTKVHAVALGDAESAMLRDVAARSGAEYKTISAAVLRQYAQ